MVDIISGQVPITFEVFITALTYVKSGRLCALAQTGAARSAHLPAVPTIGETGVSGYESAGWYGIFAPAATPQAIVARVHGEAMRIMRTADMQNRMAELGADPAADTPEQFAAFIRTETARWTQVIRAAGPAARTSTD